MNVFPRDCSRCRGLVLVQLLSTWHFVGRVASGRGVSALGSQKLIMLALCLRELNLADIGTLNLNNPLVPSATVISQVSTTEV